VDGHAPRAGARSASPRHPVKATIGATGQLSVVGSKLIMTCPFPVVLVTEFCDRRRILREGFASRA
jgi:hypothetical protein